jgi:hypothetical protein
VASKEKRMGAYPASIAAGTPTSNSDLTPSLDTPSLTGGVTGRIIDLLRRAAVDAIGHKSKFVGIDQLLIAGAHLPAIINQRGEFPI